MISAGVSQLYWMDTPARKNKSQTDYVPVHFRWANHWLGRHLPSLTKEDSTISKLSQFLILHVTAV